MNVEILTLVKEKKMLLGKDILNFLEKFEPSKVKEFLESFSNSNSRVITTSDMKDHLPSLKVLLGNLTEKQRKSLEPSLNKLGLKLAQLEKNKIEKNKEGFSLHYSPTIISEELKVKDFVNHFRSRYHQLQKILIHKNNFPNLVSIDKLSRNRQNITLIGIVTEKRFTKNENLMLKIEDLTGEINVIIRKDSDCFKESSEILLDDVISIRGSGNNEFVFAFEIDFPDSFKEQKVSFDQDICVAFLSDIHVGSNKHLGEEFSKFLEWINNDEELAPKIKYLFFVGDNVDGVGVFPGQEKLLKLKSLKEQYDLLAKYLLKIPKEITMFMCPGQHDSSRVAEPQPIIDNHYGEELHKISNLILVPNPSMIKLSEGEKEFKILMYHGASIHNFINEIEELRMMKAHKCPAKAVKYMLKKRNLAPTHSLVSYIPNKNKDPLVISETPDVLCTGEVHRLDIERYKGTLILTGSCWQSQTDFEEKVGNIPDPCKVPVLNLKSGELKILDFSENED